MQKTKSCKYYYSHLTCLKHNSNKIKVYKIAERKHSTTFYVLNSFKDLFIFVCSSQYLAKEKNLEHVYCL